MSYFIKMVGFFIRKIKFFYSSSPLFRNFFSWFASTPLYFIIMKHKISSQIKKDQKGPFNLVIETSNFCNARCLMCPYKTMKRVKKIMSDEIFEKIISRVKKEKLPINKVFFSGMGEPLTDPKLITRIAAVKKLGFPVRLYTNASLLTAAISQKLVDSGVDEVNISFNGTNPQEYEKIMGLNFQKTVQNINKLIEIKNPRPYGWSFRFLGIKHQSHSPRPFVQISSIVIEENKKSIQKHLKSWQGKVDSVTVSLAHQWGGGVKISSKLKVKSSTREPEQEFGSGLPCTQRGTRAKLKKVYPCRSLWHTLVIDSRGNFVVCCRDYESKYVLGNVITHSFAVIHQSPILEKFRQLHLQHSFNKLPQMCQKCNFPYQGGGEWLMPRALD